MGMKSFLSDELILLEPLERVHIDGNYRNWFNDPEVVRQNSHGRFPMTQRKLESYVTSTESNMSLLVLAVILREQQVHVGNISLQNIDWVDRNAEIAFILGEQKYRGKGIMFRAGQLLIQHAFNSLNLHRIYCGTLDSNISMKKLAIKLGMREEGRRQDAVYKHGQYIDVVEFGMINA